jgi:membrane-associated phospholipid phosphatase
MSIVDDDASAGDLRKSRFAAAGFIALLALSVFWPSPIVSTNRLWLNQNLAIDELSFLGREALRWDVMYWCFAGVFALLLFQTGHARMQPLRELSKTRFALPRWFSAAAIGAVVVVAFVWLFVDSAAIALAEALQSDTTEDVVRIVNRFGGGMNPPMIVIFFLVAGVVYGRGKWVAYSVAMAIAGLGAGLVAQVGKLVVGRSRPELWLGPFHYAGSGANSFPSGHTVGAFALAGVLIFASRSLPLRVVAFLLAAAVGLSRIMAFRHWPSDVVASAAIGLLASAITSTSVIALTVTSADSPHTATRK